MHPQNQNTDFCDADDPFTPTTEMVRTGFVAALDEAAGAEGFELDETKAFAGFDRWAALHSADALDAAADALDAMQTPDGGLPEDIRRDPALWLHERAQSMREATGAL